MLGFESFIHSHIQTFAKHLVWASYHCSAGNTEGTKPDKVPALRSLCSNVKQQMSKD